ncbi:hypothetical protein VPHD148_0251 [Vibrio phage D148]
MTLMEKIADAKIRSAAKSNLDKADSYESMAKRRPENASLYKSHANDARKSAGKSAREGYGLKGTATAKPKPTPKLSGKAKVGIATGALVAGALAAKARKAKKDA